MYFNAEEDRNDLFQEITLQLWKAYPNFRGDSKFTTWMYRVALNTAISFFKKEKKKKPADRIAPENLELTTSEEEQREKQEHLMMLHKAIDKLSKTDKALVLLHLDEYANKEIAEIMGISEINVRVKLTRIRKKLKTLIEE